MEAIIDPQARLIPLDSLLDGSPGNYQATVVAIPDIGRPSSAKEWSDGTDCWLLSILPGLIDNPELLEFQYVNENGTTFSWTMLLDAGDHLLEQLLVKATDLEFLKRPLLFICHGIGGLVLKRALSMLYARFQNATFDRLIGALAGIVFLGCPNPTYERPQDWSKLNQLLRATTKLSKHVLETASGEISVPARISQSFLTTRTTVPVISAVENHASKVGSAFIASKRQVLVDSYLGRTGVKAETLMHVDATHMDICNLARSSGLARQLEVFFRTARYNMTVPSSMYGMDDGESMAKWSDTASETDHIAFDMRPNMQPTGTAVTAGKSSESSEFDMVPLQQAITSANKDVKLPLFMTKPHVKNPDFYGREDIVARLRRALIPPKPPTTAETLGSGGLRTFAVCGVGGIGKTQVAAKFAFDAQGDFDAIFLLTASDTGKLAQSYVEIATELELELEGPSNDQVICKNHVLEWLSNPVWKIQERSKRRDGSTETPPKWLLIFDNADNLDVLRDYWPDTGYGSILVTSRDPLAKTRTHVSVNDGVDLEPFSTEESGQLLRNLTGFDTVEDVQLSQTIGSELSGLPLALTQIAGTILRRDMDFQEFLDLYRKSSARTDIFQSQVSSVPRSLYTVWGFEDLSPQASGLITIVSFMDADQVPEGLLLQMDQLDEDQQLKDFPKGLQAYITARTELTSSSLVKRVRQEKILVIHRIVQSIVHARMGRQQLQDAFKAALFLLHWAWPFSDFDHSTKRWLVTAPIVPHISNLHNLYRDYPFLKELREIAPEWARLLMDFGWYYIERGNFKESLPFLRTALEVCDLDPDSTWLDRGETYFCLAEATNLGGDSEGAIAWIQRSIETFEAHEPKQLDDSRLSVHHPDARCFWTPEDPHVANRTGWRLGQAYANLGDAYITAGRWTEALEQTNLAIDAYLSLPWEEYPDWAIMNKGWCLCKLGRYEEASDVFESFIEHQENEFGPMDDESWKTGQGLMYLGKVRAHQGRHAECLDLYLKALAQYDSTIGSKHFRVAALYKSIGTTHIDLKQYQDACIMLSKSLRLFEEQKEEGAQIADVLFRLASAQSMLELEVDAQSSLAQANKYLKGLEKKLKRPLTVNDLEHLLPKWAV